MKQKTLPYEERAALVVSTVSELKRLNPNISIEEVPVVKDFESAWETFQEFINRGEEGVILKNRRAPYEQGKRTKNQWKLKAFITIDAYITGFVPSTVGKGNEKLIGGFQFSTNYEGKEVVIASVSNINDATRNAATVLDADGKPTLNPEWKGKCAELIGQYINKKSFLLNLARISEWRDDKNPEDCQLLPEQVKYGTEDV